LTKTTLNKRQKGENCREVDALRRGSEEKLKNAASIRWVTKNGYRYTLEGKGELPTRTSDGRKKPREAANVPRKKMFAKR